MRSYWHVLARSHAVPVAPTGWLYDEEIWNDNPYAYYRLDEQGGTVAIDSSGNSRHGTYLETVRTAAALRLGSDSAQTFVDNGNNSGITSNGIIYSGDALSFEAWIKNPAGSGRIWGNDYDNTTSPDRGNSFFYYASVDQTIRIQLRRDATPANDIELTAAYPQDSAEHHVVATWDRATGDAKLRIYIDGTLAAESAAYDFPLRSPTVGYRLGAIAGDQPVNPAYTGDVDSVAFYDHALSAERIQRHYQAGAVWGRDFRSATEYDDAAIALSPYAFYKLDETSGTAATDSSGNARNGTYLDVARGATAVHHGSAGAQTFVDNGENSGLNTGFSLNGFTGLTLGAWINTTVTGTPQGLFYDVESGVHVGNISFAINATGNIYCKLVDEGEGAAGHTEYIITTSAAITDGADHFIVATWDGSTLRVYFDGSLVDSLATPATTLTCTQLLRIGARNSDPGENLYFPFVGKLDAALIIDRALTGTEIQDLYVAGIEWPPEPA